MIRRLLLAVVLLGGMVAAPRAHADATAPSPQIQARMNAAVEAFRLIEQRFKSGQATVDSYYMWSVRLYTSQRDAGIATAAADHGKRMQTLEALVKSRFNAGASGSDEVAAVAYYRAEAEVWVAATGKSK